MFANEEILIIKTQTNNNSNIAYTFRCMRGRLIIKSNIPYAIILHCLIIWKCSPLMMHNTHIVMCVCVCGRKWQKFNLFCIIENAMWCMRLKKKKKYSIYTNNIMKIVLILNETLFHTQSQRYFLGLNKIFIRNVYVHGCL